MAFIQGNSRCDIEIDGEVVRKTAPDPVYSIRLREQIKKQRTFLRDNRLDFCITPAVLTERTDNDIYQAEMAYINGLDFIEFVKGASRDELDRLARHVLRIIEQNVEQSRPQKIAHATLAEKVKSVAAKCSAPVLEWFAALPTNDLLLPVGACHGDLTLSNVLFCHNGIALIDFLDNFVETPLQDMVKIRQDTCFFWSCQLYRQPYDPVRTALALKYLDRKFEQLFSRYGFYTEHYRIFQFINLARILPYCETLDLQLYVEKCIKDLLNPQLNPLG